MAIDEAQLETWSHQGAIQSSRDTYAAIKTVLESPQAPYANRSYKVFLQGSYCNDTNVWADSDVDIIIRLDGAYSSDITRLSQPEQDEYNAIPNASYGYTDFKKEVVAWLSKNFNGVNPGNKAIYIPASGKRREADVLVCQQFRRYHSLAARRFDRGICFWSKGTLIENFPEQHSDNLTAKHQDARQWVKPMVRIFKNLRNYMVEQDELGDGIAPSYFLEGLLYNVPSDRYDKTYQDTFVSCYDWAVAADRSKLVCANGLHWLVRDNSSTSWPTKDCEAFFQSARRVWQGW
ncbi:nucleotidyltransferase [Vitreimonas flagellata]|uniref:nucleotidyltransferase domain-containing protein n=1 Tax=Vitreimonas flagellata TaxID=2560861 RepID=UPI0010752A09|nr:nucleotidyltransferase [Vitreimonas flagellata]